MVINVAQDQQVALEVESKSEMLVEPGLENIPTWDALYLFRLEARVVGILRQEFQGLGKLGAGILRQLAGGLGEAVRVDEVHGFLRRAGFLARRSVAI
jgi:hypothetical protein